MLIEKSMAFLFLLNIKLIFSAKGSISGSVFGPCKCGCKSLQDNTVEICIQISEMATIAKSNIKQLVQIPKNIRLNEPVKMGVATNKLN